MARLNADRRQTRRSQPVMKPLRQRPGLKPDARDVKVSAPKQRNQIIRMGGNLALKANLPLLVNNLSLQRQVRLMLRFLS